MYSIYLVNAKTLINVCNSKQCAHSLYYNVYRYTETVCKLFGWFHTIYTTVADPRRQMGDPNLK